MLTLKVGIILFITAIGQIPMFSSILLEKPFTLKLSMFLSMTGNRIASPECVHAAKIVTELFNNRTDMLKDYNIVIDMNDDACIDGDGVKLAVPLLFENDRVIQNGTSDKAKWLGKYQIPEIGSIEVLHDTAKTAYVAPVIAGPLCSGSCKEIGKLLRQSNMISFTGSACLSQELDDHKKYPNTFRMISAGQAVDLYIELADVMNWREIALISDSSPYGILVTFNNFFQVFEIQIAKFDR